MICGSNSGCISYFFFLEKLVKTEIFFTCLSFPIKITSTNICVFMFIQKRFYNIFVSFSTISIYLTPQLVGGSAQILGQK